MDIQLQNKKGELFWRQGKLHEVQVTVEEGQISITRKNSLAEEIINKKDIHNERKLKIKRTVEKLGMELRGGLGTKIPLTVSAINKGKDVEISGQPVSKGDVLLHVNGESMLNKDLMSARDFIGTIKDEVELHLVQLKEREKIYENTGKDVPTPDERDYNIIRAIGNGRRISVHNGSLALASITSYRKGNNILMPHTLSLTTTTAGTILLHCSAQRDDLKEWTDVLSMNVLVQNHGKLNELKDNFDLADLAQFGWVFERVQSSDSMVVWLRKFLVLRDEKIQIYSKYPESAADWNRPEKSYELLNIFVRPIKDDELSDLRTCSVMIQTPTDNHIISFEYANFYHNWLQSIENSRNSAALKLKSISFKGSWNKRFVNFILDIDQGFVVQDHTTHATYWELPFSLLRDSRDNGRSILILEFKNNQIKEIELREIVPCVHSMEAFISAKVQQQEAEQTD